MKIWYNFLLFIVITLLSYTVITQEYKIQQLEQKINHLDDITWTMHMKVTDMWTHRDFVGPSIVISIDKISHKTKQFKKQRGMG